MTPAQTGNVAGADFGVVLLEADLRTVGGPIDVLVGEVLTFDVDAPVGADLAAELQVDLRAGLDPFVDGVGAKVLDELAVVGGGEAGFVAVFFVVEGDVPKASGALMKSTFLPIR